MFQVFKTEWFSILFSLTIISISIASAGYDLYSPNETYWFQRSGALVVLAGVELQYSAITALWPKNLESVAESSGRTSPMVAGQGFDIRGLAEGSERTRMFAPRVHDTVSRGRCKETFAVGLIVVGTMIWGYGDLSFKSWS